MNFRFWIPIFLFLSFAASAADFMGDFKEKLVEGIQADLSRRMDLPPQSFQVQLTGTLLKPEPMTVLKEKSIKSVEVLGLDNATAQRFDGFASFPVIIHSEMGDFDFKVQSVIRVVGPVYLAAQALARDSQTSESSFRLSSMPWKQLPTGVAAFSVKDLIGKRVVRFVPAGAAVHPSYMDVPYAVKAGEMVDLTVLSGPGVMIRSRAVAKEPGRIGEIINLTQPATKKKMRAIIVGQRKVEVRL